MALDLAVEKQKAMEESLKAVEMLAKVLVEAVVFPALEKVVADSSTKIDDMVLAAMEAPLKKACLEMVDQIYKGA